MPNTFSWTSPSLARTFQLSERNAPPRFIHIVIKAGDLTEAFPFSFPSAPPSPPEPPKRYHEEPSTFGRFTWGTHEGLLVLAPKFPVGGIDGGHLIFSWTEGQTEVALSLRAWAPLPDAIATLQAIVVSIQ